MKLISVAALVLLGVGTILAQQPSLSQIQGTWRFVPPPGAPAARGPAQVLIFKLTGNTIWGVIGSGDVQNTWPLEDGKLEGDTFTFYINHFDTGNSTDKLGQYRNVLVGKLMGDMIVDIKWRREPGGPDDGQGGSMPSLQKDTGK
jgi:hypothetical protein